MPYRNTTLGTTRLDRFNLPGQRSDDVDVELFTRLGTQETCHIHTSLKIRVPATGIARVCGARLVSQAQPPAQDNWLLKPGIASTGQDRETG